MTDTIENTDTSKQREFAIQRIYVKDKSFETKDTPHIFEREWNPQMDLHIQSRHAQLKENLYEVVLQLTITVNSQDKLAFMAEVHQAGIFSIQNFPDEELHRLIGQICPSTLYPYARAIVTGMVSEGSFPGLYLAPINFEALYMQSLQQAQAVGEGEGSPATIN